MGTHTHSLILSHTHTHPWHDRNRHAGPRLYYCSIATVTNTWQAKVLLSVRYSCCIRCISLQLMFSQDVACAGVAGHARTCNARWPLSAMIMMPGTWCSEYCICADCRFFDAPICWLQPDRVGCHRRTKLQDEVRCMESASPWQYMIYIQGCNWSKYESCKICPTPVYTSRIHFMIH